MTHHSKFLPVLALAVALAPFAAQARSGRGAVQTPPQQQFLVGEYGNGNGPAFAPGRTAAANPPSNQLIVISSEQFAAAVNAVPEEN
jgi:hypothetical protein